MTILMILRDKISIDPVQFRPSVKVHFPVELQVISDMLFCLLIGPTVDVTNGLRQTYTPQMIVLFCC
jgi:hypothetical protein